MKVPSSRWSLGDQTKRPGCILYDLFKGDGRELIAEAMRTRIVLREHFPDAEIRIHGFNNKSLDKMDEVVRDGRAAGAKFWRRSTPEHRNWLRVTQKLGDPPDLLSEDSQADHNRE